MANREASDFLDRLAELTRALRAVAAESYASFEVGSTQARFLRQIGRSKGISQAELARATQTDPALTGRALETLVDRGWVRRRRSEADRRQYVLELSAAGERTRKRVEDARAAVAERIVGELDDRDLDDFERIAKKLLAVFESP